MLECVTDDKKKKEERNEIKIFVILLLMTNFFLHNAINGNEFVLKIQKKITKKKLFCLRTTVGVGLIFKK